MRLCLARLERGRPRVQGRVLSRLVIACLSALHGLRHHLLRRPATPRITPCSLACGNACAGGLPAILNYTPGSGHSESDEFEVRHGRGNETKADTNKAENTTTAWKNRGRHTLHLISRLGTRKRKTEVRSYQPRPAPVRVSIPIHRLGVAGDASTFGPIALQCSFAFEHRFFEPAGFKRQARFFIVTVARARISSSTRATSRALSP